MFGDYDDGKGAGIDVLVNNAAYCVVGAVEEVGVEQVGRMFETNFLGVLRVQRAVLGRMREKKSGCVVNLSSALGMSTWPSCGLYGASKFAVEGECLLLSFFFLAKRDAGRVEDWDEPD